jgi:glycosyltransferase involved in cell wall biosynthesis
MQDRLNVDAIHIVCGVKISVITVCYNSAATVRCTIESALSQSYSNVEHVIVDGGSTDHTLKIIAEYQGRIARGISEPDQGLYDAMNKGIRAATGEVIGILNSGKFFEAPNVLAEVADEFAACSLEPRAYLHYLLKTLPAVKAPDGFEASLPHRLSLELLTIPPQEP